MISFHLGKEDIQFHFRTVQCSNAIAHNFDQFNDCNFGIVNSVNNLINVGHSFSMAVVFQRMSHIPALSGLLLETYIVNFSMKILFYVDISNY